jgi:ATP-binding cassette subfamily F protein uup
VLTNIQDAILAYGDHPLLDGATLQIHKNERVCLVGRNGAGKSTLLKVIEGSVQLDSGTRQIDSATVIARLQQDPPQVTDTTVYHYVANGYPELGEFLNRYFDLAHDPELGNSAKKLKELERAQEEIEKRNGWAFDTEIQKALSRLNLNPDQPLAGLSGGWLRKVALARALARQPDILLLDEPTNHLDISTIQWLEEFLLGFNATLVFISHDRAFISRLATRIVDIDRGVLTSWPGSYEKYVEGKAEWLRVEEEKNALFDKRLAEEEVWIRQGIKARRTRNEGRVRALKALRNERSDRVNHQGTSKMQLGDGVRSGKLVFEAEALSFAFDDKPIVNHFDFSVMRGEKIALVGANGCGKSTLLKILLGQLEPTGGSLKVGTKLEVAYFDQYRQALDPEQSVMDNLADGKQEVEVNGRMRHALGYLQDFLFAPKRAFTPVKALSGGEKNRLLLAKLFLKPANLLVLDEPTNDLDVETLELLEDLVANYQGTLFLVSHDRAFIDNTATQIWYFDGTGHIETAVGGYQELQRQLDQKEVARAAMASAKSTPAENSKPEAKAAKPKSKLSYKQRMELEALPEQLAAAEAKLEELQAQVNDPAFFNRDPQSSQATLVALSDAEAKLEVLFARWEELESLA